ncbi:hypothetical protein E2C01_083123 [Portunus trituberculatus]|uniref:Uncharacterized protein n=1 Tax=Portunus trituberculatus TaxID=210409 RepID=A0A5B7J0B4_PORTR|nr:hypothetical protein [Portunus trituberculatus]
MPPHPPKNLPLHCH